MSHNIPRESGPARQTGAGRPHLNRRQTLGLAALAGLVLFFLSDAVFRGRVFYERDIHLDWYTQMDSFTRSIRAGAWPLWDNSIAFGQPLLADPSAQILYPLTWLNLLMKPWWYYTIFVAFHMLLAGFGLYCLALRLGLSRLGALLAAGVWTTSGPFVSMLNAWHHFAGAAWIPWVLLAAHQAIESPRLRRSVLWAIVMACQVVAGSADMCAMTSLLVAGLVASRLRWRSWNASANLRLLSHGLVAAAVGALLSAAVWLPVLDNARRSSRWHLPEDARTPWSLQPAALTGLVLPARVEDLAEVLPPRLAPNAESSDPFLASLYVGIAAVPLVVAGLLSRRRDALFLGVAGAAALLGALGPHAPFYAFAIHALPALRIFRYPSKAMIVVAIAWATLAGMGLDSYRQKAPRHRVMLSFWAAALVALFVVGLRRPPAETPNQWTFAMACGLCTAMALVPRRKGGGLPVGWALLVAFLTAADVCVVHRGMNRTAPASLVTFRPPAVDAAAAGDRSRIYVYDYMAPGKSREHLKRDDPYLIRTPTAGSSLETTRVISQGLYPFPPAGGRWGLEGSFDLDLRGLYPLPLANLVTLLLQVEGTPSHLRLLKIGAVRTVLALHAAGFEDLIPIGTLPSYFPEAIHVFRVPDPLPRTYAVGIATAIADDRAYGRLIDPAFDPSREILLPTDAPIGSAAHFTGTSRIVEFEPDRIRLEAELRDDGYVVLVDSYDPGWHATVDGADAPVLRANVAFRAVKLPSGRHIVDFEYRPAAAFWGLALSALGITLAFALPQFDRRVPFAAPDGPA